MSRREDIKRLIASHTRLLQKLKEQQASFGLHTPPHVLTEIEDRETEIEKLQLELKNLVEKKDPSSLEERQKHLKLAKVAPIILVAIIGLIGMFMTAILASPVIVTWFQKTSPPTNVPAETPDSSLSLMPTTNTATPLFATATNVVAVATTPLELNCIENYLSDITLERQISLEVGSTQQDLDIPAEDRIGNDPIGPLAARLTRNGQPIAAVRFLVLHQGDTVSSFSILTVIDGDCDQVADYENVTRPHSLSTLQNWDVLGIPLVDRTYVLRFGWQGDHIRFSFRELQ